VCGVGELTQGWHYRILALSVAGLAAIISCMMLTRQELAYWQDSETLLRHALEVKENNYLAHVHLGGIQLDRGRTEEAAAEFEEAIRLQPQYAEAHYNLGLDYGKRGRI